MNLQDSETEITPTCPICLDELDITDRNFKPCTCGYQVRLFFKIIFFKKVIYLKRCVDFVGIA